MWKIRFYRSEQDFIQFHQKLKNLPCPHCKCVGFLILHGFLKGFILPDKPDAIRGHRIFCSNRNRKKGCGRTFSIVLSWLISRLAVTTHQLFKFIGNIVSGSKIKAALDISYSEKSKYRLYRKWISRQPAIRTRLLMRSQPPFSKHHHSPPAETSQHLKLCFKHVFCAFEAFQFHCQTAIL